MNDIVSRALHDLALRCTARIYLKPVGLAPPGHSLSGARRLAGGWLAFDRCEVISRSDASIDRLLVPLTELVAWAEAEGDDAPARRRCRELLANFGSPRPPFAGIDLGRPLIMGVVNVTPDSFSDGGEYLDPERAIDHALTLAKAGADIVDIGAESTRPGARAVDPEVQIARVCPVVGRLAAQGLVVSIDTRHAAVMREALKAGARIVNDVSGLTYDPQSLETVAASEASVVLMHMRDTPETMNMAPSYGEPALDVFDELEERVQACEAAGITRDRILIDPGIGFAKRIHQGAEVIRSLALFQGLGCGMLVGFSRKGLMRRWAEQASPQERLPGSLAAAVLAFEQGVQVLRVHDVAATVQARDVWEFLRPQ